MTYQPPAPPPPPPAAAPRSDRTQTYGWIGIVVGLLCCGILGIVFGALSLREAEKYSQSKTLGYIAIAVSIINMIGGITWTAIRR